MERDEKNPQEELRILTHEPVKGYRPALIAFIAMGVLYLAVILARTL